MAKNEKTEGTLFSETFKNEEIGKEKKMIFDISTKKQTSPLDSSQKINIETPNFSPAGLNETFTTAQQQQKS